MKIRDSNQHCLLQNLEENFPKQEVEVENNIDKGTKLQKVNGGQSMG